MEQAEEAEADMIVTACAYCKQMLEDSVKVMNLDDKIQVEDLASVLLASLEDEEAHAESA